MRKNNAFVAKIVNTRLTKGFIAIFAPAESLPSPATLTLVMIFALPIKKLLMTLPTLKLMSRKVLALV